MAAAFAQTDHYELAGCLSPIHWIRLNCHMTSGTAADRVVVGERSGDLRASVEAMTRREIVLSHVALIARRGEALAYSGTGQQFGGTALPDHAQAFSAGRFRNSHHH